MKISAVKKAKPDAITAATGIRRAVLSDYNAVISARKRGQTALAVVALLGHPATALSVIVRRGHAVHVQPKFVHVSDVLAILNKVLTPEQRAALIASASAPTIAAAIQKPDVPAPAPMPKGKHATKFVTFTDDGEADPALPREPVVLEVVPPSDVCSTCGVHRRALDEIGCPRGKPAGCLLG